MITLQRILTSVLLADSPCCDVKMGVVGKGKQVNAESTDLNFDAKETVILLTKVRERGWPIFFTGSAAE